MVGVFCPDIRTTSSAVLRLPVLGIAVDVRLFPIKPFHGCYIDACANNLDQATKRLKPAPWDRDSSTAAIPWPLTVRRT
ncbi:hypothetical protein J2W42_006445 [Rhizobium tibeticum]|nr:hypothetical protein [Rhizobium tibeticum]